ncbi:MULTISPECIES: ArsR/SmtB family transcription factor [Actinomycetes]|uniref:Metalloregulator ArsR/SmtB family transcription factor n=2 Tax=Actinomycetes TaxID=1760 RepID=A0ABP6LQ54_9MICC|nr:MULTISPECIES: metalloregulator ArsR/SmtB family transcription factor [unclassified Nesterenkonia]MDS2173251.1 metalloregulator ArsR/SmtB family transcription factor [Nesterenkonia sp. CL21]OSM43630.1 transcriptional regulator [Nesterenkonia sp. PF2B19]
MTLSLTSDQADGETSSCCTPQPGTPALDAEAAVELAARLKALADPNRLTLLALVAADARGEACVCDLTGPLDLGQPTVSHHLKILVDAGLLTREKRGVWSYYAVVDGALESIAHAVGHGIVPPHPNSPLEPA